MICRFGWNFESFHTLLSESLAHELLVASRALEGREHVPGAGEASGGRGSDVGKGKGGEMGQAKERADDATGAREVAGEGCVEARRAWTLEVGLRLRGLTRLQEILEHLMGTVAGREAGLKPPPGMRRLAQLCEELRSCLPGAHA